LGGGRPDVLRSERGREKNSCQEKLRWALRKGGARGRKRGRATVVIPSEPRARIQKTSSKHLEEYGGIGVFHEHGLGQANMQKRDMARRFVTKETDSHRSESSKVARAVCFVGRKKKKVRRKKEETKVKVQKN